ncbi:Heat shock factor-binding protein 1 [Balamuthia mandrillaris]
MSSEKDSCGGRSGESDTNVPARRPTAGAQDDVPPSSQQQQDLNVMVETVLQQMQLRFEQMSDAILGKIDDMGARITQLEKSMGDLMESAGVSLPPPPSSSSTQPRQQHSGPSSLSQQQQQQQQRP